MIFPKDGNRPPFINNLSNNIRCVFVFVYVISACALQGAQAAIQCFFK